MKTVLGLAIEKKILGRTSVNRLKTADPLTLDLDYEKGLPQRQNIATPNLPTILTEQYKLTWKDKIIIYIPKEITTPKFLRGRMKFKVNASFFLYLNFSILWTKRDYNGPKETIMDQKRLYKLRLDRYHNSNMFLPSSYHQNSNIQ